MLSQVYQKDRHFLSQLIVNERVGLFFSKFSEGLGGLVNTEVDYFKMV